MRKAHKSYTLRQEGRVIDIPKRPDAASATDAGKVVVVKPLLSGDCVVCGEQCIAWSSGSRPKPFTISARNNDKVEQLG